MRNLFSKFALTAAFGLALAFTFSCSDDKDDGGGGGLTGTSGTFVDSRDSTSYKWVKIGKQYWMAENLNYAGSGKCYGEGGTVDTQAGTNNLSGSGLITLSPAEIQANCTTYGRLYTWKGANEACPSGWHLPDTTEWKVLMKFINPSCSDADDSDCSGVGTKLKAISGWDASSGNGTDDYGFSALPGGFDETGVSGFFIYLGKRGGWWSSKRTDYTAYYWSISGSYISRGYHDTIYKYSVRCVKD